MKTTATLILTLVFCFSLVTPAAGQSTLPTFSIVGVNPTESITILGHNFPANHIFDVLMGEIHTRGIGGTLSGSINTHTGGTISATLKIPAALRSNYQIAVRLQSRTNPNYFAYNWFYNFGHGLQPIDPVPGSPLPSGKPSPYFMINGAVRDAQVTITTHNFPNNHRFNVRMGALGTRGINGVLVDTVSTGSSPTQSFTFVLPAALRGLAQIAIRLESANETSGYFAYNWFSNSTYGSTGGVDPQLPLPAQPGTRILPTISISGVAQDAAVSITAYNLPPNKYFEVRLGALGTRGVGGMFATSFYSGGGGTMPMSIGIPASVRGLPELAIRIQTVDGSGYYAYNWFYNRTAR